MNKKLKKFNEDEMFDLFDEKDFETVKKFVSKYGIDAVDRDGRNALINFILAKKTKFALALIKDYKEMDLNQQDKLGYSALHFAVQENNVKVVEALIKNGAEIDITENNGNTPLWRGLFDQVDEKILIELLNSGADIKKKNKHGVNPLEFLDSSLPKVKKWTKENLKK